MQRRNRSPSRARSRAAAERRAVARADRAAAELLGRRRDAVEEEAADQHEIVQHGVGRQHMSPARAPCAAKKAERRSRRRCGS